MTSGKKENQFAVVENPLLWSIFAGKWHPVEQEWFTEFCCIDCDWDLCAASVKIGC